MRFSTRPRLEAVLGLEPEPLYIGTEMGSCDPRSRRNTETCHVSMDVDCSCSQMRSRERGAGNCVENSVMCSYEDRELQSL